MDFMKYQPLWYAVQTKPRQESTASQILERLGVETFCPRLEPNKALFPSYIFAKFMVDTHLRRVKFAQGVKGVVSFGPEPASVEDDFLETIRVRIKNGFVRMETPYFDRGERVVITEGPLSGIEGIFDCRLRDSDRVVILLNILTGHGRVVIQNRMLRKAS